MRFGLLIFCFSFGITWAYSQNSIDLLTLSGKYGFPSSYEPAQPSKATESEVLANIKIPIVFNDKTIWYSNFTYTYMHVGNSLDLGNEIANPINLNGFVLQTGLVQRIDEKRAFQLLFVPRFMSDMVNPGSDAWQFGAIGLFENRFNKNLLMRFGVLYNQEMSGPLLVPLVDIDWQITPRWSITGLLPIYGKVNYKISERTTTGFSLFGLVTSYALSDPDYSMDYMERTSIDLSLFAKWKMVGNIYLEGRFGYALARRYNQYNKDQTIDLKVSILKFGDDRGEPVNPVFNDGLIANLRLVYSLSIE